MRRLSFLISFISVGMLCSCGNHKDDKSKREPIVENGQPNLNFGQDSVVPASGGNTTDTIVTKAKNKGKAKKEAPNHGVPDQQKLDSIKAAKAKEKYN